MPRASRRQGLSLPQAIRQAAAFHKQRRLAEAARLYLGILESKPDHFDALRLLGLIRRQQERYEEAATLFRRALKTKPDSAEALANLGAVLRALNRYDEAIASYEKALAIKPDYSEVHYNLGNVFNALNCHDKAIVSYEKALSVRPDHAETLINLGNVLAKLNRHAEAISSYDKALSIKPDHAEALSNRGNALRALNRHAEAIASYEKALSIKPEHAEALNNRGNALRDLNRHAEAIASYEEALAIRPDFADAHLNESIARLCSGDFQNGWRKYEWRRKRSGLIPPKRDFPQPLWLGQEELEGKMILLHAEQGLGDTIQFVRYAPLVARRGASVILGVQMPLKSLFEGLDGVERIVGEDEPLPGFDVHCPLPSLPLAFGTALESIPADIPYLVATERKIAEWRARLGERRGPRIGMVWAGRPAHKNDHNRSIPLTTLLSRLSMPGIEFVSLQKDHKDGDAETLKSFSDIAQFAEDLKDFSDTAAVVSLMDLVISVDTAVAHLAGALGKPVWILLPFSPDWRWLLNRDDSPWYPTARLFRQPRIADWEAVIERVKQELLTIRGNSGFS